MDTGEKPKAVWLCNTCGKPVEVLKACGAVNFFCHHCNELKSKSAVTKQESAQ